MIRLIRAVYREKLLAYFKTCESELDEDSVRRLERNPLRILDSKNPDMQEIIAGAPALQESLSKASGEHFEKLLELLEAVGIAPIVNPRLVRGLDYYSHTVFEWTTQKLGSQSAVCAGGRYDGLLEQMGAKNMPGVGWAFGMERVIALLDALERTPAAAVPDVFVMASNEVSAADSLALAEYVRQLLPACSVLHNTGAGSLKSQFKKADKSGATVAIVVGSEEIERSTVTLKPLLSRVEQISVTRTELQKQLQTLLAV